MKKDKDKNEKDLIIGKIKRWLQINGKRTSHTIEHDHHDKKLTYKLVLPYSYNVDGQINNLECRCQMDEEFTNLCDNDLKTLTDILESLN